MSGRVVIDGAVVRELLGAAAEALNWLDGPTVAHEEAQSRLLAAVLAAREQLSGGQP